MASRTITGPVYKPGGNTPWANARIKFKPVLFATTINTYPAETYIAETDSAGDFSIILAVPDSGAVNYEIIFPDASVVTYALGSGSTLSLAAIVNAGTTLGTPNELEQLISEAASDKTYRHVQSAASATWVITHNLNKYPSVTIVDSAGDMVFGAVSIDSINQVTVSFSAAFSGEAYIN
jgi:hypothetical protein